MTGDWIGIALDLIIITLLAATIMTAYRLNHRLSLIRQGRHELEILVRGFSESTQRAEAGVRIMRQTASDTGEHLLRQIDRAKALRDELAIMIETADSLCNRLDLLASRLPTVAVARPPDAVENQSQSAAVHVVVPPASSEAGMDLPLRQTAAMPQQAGRAGVTALRVGKDRDGEGRSAASPVVDQLSRAERELLQVIEKLR